MDRKLRSDEESARPEQAPESLTQLRPATIAAGELIGNRYRVERVIAEGGMGIIVAARHVELEEIVAIKFLKHEFVINPEIVGRFAREAKAAASIKSHHSTTVHDVGTSSEHGPYIVMEYLEGRDLETVLHTEGRLPVALATELVMQAGEAIASAHALNIIHRDIKPANLFLVGGQSEVPILKVLDFGVSKTALTGHTFGGSISLIKTQSLLGSPIYMAPEQIRGREVTFQSDVWSLGAVLYELVTGTTAFTGNSITELCAAVLETEPQPISDNVPEVPAGLSDAILRCLEKDPARRWSSIAEFISSLAPFAPKRARLSVERAIAVSKGAGLVPHHFVAPLTVPPPASGTSLTPAFEPAGPELSIPPEPEEGGRTKRGLVVGLIAALTVGGITTGALYASRHTSPPPPTPAAVATTAQAPSATVEQPVSSPLVKTPAATASPTEAARPTPPPPPPPPPSSLPVAATGNVARPIPRAAEPRPLVNRPAAPTVSTVATATPSVESSTKKSDQVRSAIDDRK